MDLLFLSLTRNCASKLDHNLFAMKHLAKQYSKKYKFFVYANDITDNTEDILKSHNVDFTIETLNWPKFPEQPIPERAQKMATARNKLMDYARAYENYDYIVMFDSDITTFPLINFDSMFNEEYDYIGSTGVTIYGGRTVMYDVWAFLPIGQPHYRPLIIDVPPIHGIIPVQSCFGGVAVFKHELCKNDFFPHWGLCEHGGFCSQIKRVGMNTGYKPIR